MINWLGTEIDGKSIDTFDENALKNFRRKLEFFEKSRHLSVKIQTKILRQHQ